MSEIESMIPTLERIKALLFRYVDSVSRRPDPIPFFSFATLLTAFSAVYGGYMVMRARLYAMGAIPSRRLPCRVIAIGNLIAGGTGKTPMTILVAKLMRDLGLRVVVISRGYKGRLEAAGGVVSDGITLFKTALDAGDEPYLMARVLKDVPVIVGKDRYAAGLLAVSQFDPDVIVLDDAFQHLRLKRDLDLLLFDHRAPLGNGHLVPRGRLREPLSAMRRAQAVVYTRCKGNEDSGVLIKRFSTNYPLFYTHHFSIIRTSTDCKESAFLTEATSTDILRGKRVVAFSGLADNHQFLDSLVAVGCEIIHSFFRPDHHHYTMEEVAVINTVAKQLGADAVVTTLKDYVKLESAYPNPVMMIAVDVAIEFGDGLGTFRMFLMNALGLH